MKVTVAKGIERRRFFQGEDTLYDIENALVTNGQAFSVVEERGSVAANRAHLLVDNGPILLNPPPTSTGRFGAYVKDNRRTYVSRSEPGAFRYVFSGLLGTDTTTPHEFPTLSASVGRGNIEAASSGGGIGDNGILNGFAVSYLLIPKDEFGAAGPWYYGSFRATTGTSQQFNIYFRSRGSTAEVEIYRTKQYRQYPSSATIEDLQLYRVGIVSTRKDEDIVFNVKSRWPQALEADPVEDRPVYGPMLVRRPNLLASHVISSAAGVNPMYTNIGFKTARNDGGVGLFGGVHLPAARPQFFTAQPGSGYDVRYQFFYETPTGRAYGPAVESTDTNVRVPFVGADGLLVLFKVAGAPNWLLYKEYKVPGAMGFYDESANEIEDAYNFPSNYTFSTTRAGTHISVAPPFAAPADVESVHKPNLLIQSELFRMMEWSSAPVEFPMDEAILLVETARPEEMDQRSFEFYIFTNKGIYYAQRGESGITTYPLSENFTCAQGPSGIPIYTKTDAGLVVYTSAGRIVLISGRQINYLDSPVQGKEVILPLWSSVFSIVYNPTTREIYVTTNAGTFSYSFEETMWSGHLDNTLPLLQVRDRSIDQIYVQDGTSSFPWEMVPGAADSRVTTGMMNLEKKGRLAEVVVQATPGVESVLQVLVTPKHTGTHPFDMGGQSIELIYSDRPIKTKIFGKRYAFSVKKFVNFNSLLVTFI